MLPPSPEQPVKRIVFATGHLEQEPADEGDVGQTPIVPGPEGPRVPLLPTGLQVK